MTTFQLDQCFDCKRFARDCANEGLCHTLRMPTSLRNAPDPDMLSVVMARAHPLVTFDRELPDEHTPFIPDSHPGILIVTNAPSPQTMTVAVAQRVLSRFKRAVPNWHDLVWANSIVELSAIGAEVWHLSKRQLIHDGYFSLDLPDWSSLFLSVLNRNANPQS